MNDFLKLIAGILIAVILSLVLSKENKDLAILVSILVVSMTVICGLRFLQPVLLFFEDLELTGNLDSQMAKLLLKATGISILAEIATLICEDSGHQAMGKSLQIAATTVILWLSVPLFQKLMTLLENILGVI